VNARSGLMASALEVLGTARMAAAISVAALGLMFCSRLVRSLIGWPGFLAALVTLVVLAGLSLFARRASLEWRGLLPVSLLVFVGWCGLTVFWSNYNWATLGSVLYLVAIAVLAIYVALTRDLLQTIRAVGDVLRFTLVLSLAIEVFAGLLIDMPIRFLGVEGNLGTGSPIQGIFGLRNSLGTVALIGLITFIIEYRTKSVTRLTAGISLSVAGLGLLLTRSPVVFGAALVVGVAAVVLLVLRRLPAPRRRFAQWVLLSTLVVVTALTYLLRGPIIAILNAGSEFEARYALWQRLQTFIGIKPLEGWGWIGAWRTELQPYDAINTLDSRGHGSGLNAFLDVWMQVGLVGLFCFLVLVALTFWRSWVLASVQRGVIIIWPALILVALIVISLAESSILTDYGWMLFVICAVVAADKLSWRNRFKPALEQEQL